jgi:chaperone required for assembly of F1-ATPase
MKKITLENSIKRKIINKKIFKVNPKNWKYGEKVLFLKDKKLYILQYSNQSPDNLDRKQKSEYLPIIDSFEVI